MGSTISSGRGIEAKENDVEKQNTPGYTQLTTQPPIEPNSSSLNYRLDEHLGKHLGEHMEGDTISWSADAYGYLTFSVLKAFARKKDHGNKRKESYSVFFAVLLYLLVLGMQLFITAFLLLSAAEMEEKVTDDYFMKHYGVDMQNATDQLTNAAANKEPLIHAGLDCEDGAGLHFLCSCQEQLKVQLPVFYHIMITFWTVRMLNEAKTIFWWFMFVIGMAKPTAGNRIEVERDEDDPTQIRTVERLDILLKCVFLLLDPLMRLFVAGVLMFAGAKFLLVQTDQSSLVMKVLTMQFVIQVDDYLYSSLVTKKAQDEIHNAKLCTEYGSPKRDTWWENGLGSTVYLLLCLGFVYYIEKVCFAEITYFRFSCRQYRKAMQNSTYNIGTRMSFMEMIRSVTS